MNARSKPSTNWRRDSMIWTSKGDCVVVGAATPVIIGKDISCANWSKNLLLFFCKWRAGLIEFHEIARLVHGSVLLRLYHSARYLSSYRIFVFPSMKTGNSKSLYGICDTGQRMHILIDCFLNKEAGVCSLTHRQTDAGQPADHGDLGRQAMCLGWQRFVIIEFWVAVDLTKRSNLKRSFDLMVKFRVVVDLTKRSNLKWCCFELIMVKLKVWWRDDAPIALPLSLPCSESVS